MSFTRMGSGTVVWIVLVAFLLLVLPVSTLASPPKYKTEWGSQGTGDGQFLLPVAVTVDGQGRIYVADSQAGRVQKFDAAGHYMTAWGIPGAEAGQFARPLGLAVDASDRVYVVDAILGRVQVFDSSGSFLSQWGTRSLSPVAGEFYFATNVAISPDGRIYVTDQGSVSEPVGHNVQVFDGSGTYVFQWGGQGSSLGRLFHPFGIVTDEAGDVYVADSLNQRIQKFDGLGNFMASWGSAGTGDGQFNRPLGMAYDAAAGLLYVVDGLNDRVQVFDRSGSFVSSFGSRGSGSGQLDVPLSVAVDAAGDVYVVDSLNFRIQKFGTPDLDIEIDVKPGSNNRVNLRSNGLMNVAILTTGDFDAGDADPLTLELGPGGATIFHAGGHFEDVDGDGDLDLMVHFRIQETGILCGDVSVTLTGSTFDGDLFEGTDTIVTQGCQ